MKKFLFGALVFLSTSTTAFAFDGIYLGGRVGFVGLSGDQTAVFSNSLGFGVDVGFRTNPVLEVLLGFEHSSPSGGPGMSLNAGTVSAQLHFLQVDDFDFSVHGGPGFYFYNTGTSQTNFGLHGGAAADVVIEDALRVGLMWRYNAAFSSTIRGGSYYTVMARIGYFFDVSH